MKLTHRLSRKTIRVAAVAALMLIAAVASAVLKDPADAQESRLIHGMSAVDSCALELFEEGTASPENPQERVRFPASLGWTTSAVWNREKLFLADTTHERVVTAGLTGRVEAIDFAATAKEGPDEPLRDGPSFVSPRAGGGFAVGYFFKERGQMSARHRVFFAAPEGEAQAETRFEDRFLEPKGRIYFDPSRQQKMVCRGFFQGVTTDRGLFMVGGAETREPKPRYVPLLAYVDHQEFVAYRSPLPDDELRQLTSKTFARDLSLMTVVEEDGESVAYLLFLEEEPKTPWIGRARTSSPEIERLPYFPQKWSRLSRTEIENPASTTINQYVASIEQYYRSIEKSEMPVGIHSWKNRLFILAKGKANPTNGRTAWQLVEVSKENGKAIRETPLPSTSEHILLVPSTDEVGLFAILEKGAVDVIDNLRIHYLYRPGNNAVLFPETRLDVTVPTELLYEKSKACPATLAGLKTPA